VREGGREGGRRERAREREMGRAWSQNEFGEETRRAWEGGDLQKNIKNVLLDDSSAARFGNHLGMGRHCRDQISSAGQERLTVLTLRSTDVESSRLTKQN
jgi:hypothetical protein